MTNRNSPLVLATPTTPVYKSSQLYAYGFKGAGDCMDSGHSLKRSWIEAPVSSSDSSTNTSRDYGEDVALTRAERDRSTWDCAKFRHRKYTKLVSSIIFFLVALLVSTNITVIVHERVPPPSLYPPLPDLILDNIPCWPWGLAAAEWILTTLNVVWLLVVFFHHDRCIVLTRCLLIVGTTYLLRCSTMLFTSVSAAPQCSMPACGPYPVGSPAERFVRSLKLLVGFGMSINSIQTCGDYIFSGHTAMLTLLSLFIIEYTPWPSLALLQVACALASASGIYFTLAHHGHYTVDVVLGFVIAVLLFRSYHTVVNSSAFAADIRSRRLQFWFPVLVLFEKDNPNPIENSYDWPFDVTRFRHLVRRKSCCSQKPQYDSTA